MTLEENHTHGLGIWGNPRVPMLIRIDEGIKKQFKKEISKRSQTQCETIEILLEAFIQYLKEG